MIVDRGEGSGGRGADEEDRLARSGGGEAKTSPMTDNRKAVVVEAGMNRQRHFLILSLHSLSPLYHISLEMGRCMALRSVLGTIGCGTKGKKRNTND
ncbi:hypothetical protein L1987_42543 [Smallanthus sonchifolius]|uniref:Uncharacterized protein n=1 Tax=Smallanthus sonchifolius TaxID=185202 RepID=A0ACB9GK49_9ASTR|nr:hypothetical protein L1987_42543 [Smallanthus sonchifolius]